MTSTRGTWSRETGRLASRLGLALLACSCVKSGNAVPDAGRAGSDAAGETDAAAGADAAATPRDAGAPDASSPGRPPNIVLIITDDQRWDSIDCMPKLQELVASRGVTFTRSFATTPLCCPGRSSVLTGRYAHNHRVLRNGSGEDEDGDSGDPEGGAVGFRDHGNEALVFARWLQEAGYRTGFFGKYMNGYSGLVQEDRHVPPYWDSWHAFPQADFYGFELVERDDPDDAARLVCYRSELVPQSCECEPGDCDEIVEGEELHSNDVLADKAATFIQSSAGGPFFVYVALKAPHMPALAPLRYDANPDPDVIDLTGDARDRLLGCPLWSRADSPPSVFEEDVSDKPEWVQRRQTENDDDGFRDLVELKRQLQLSSLLSVDDAVEVVVNALQVAGVADDTVLLFTSDNGYAWGEHWWHKKNCAFEECARVPLVAALPGSDAPGRLDDRVVLNVDLAATFAELAGGRVPADAPVDGRSLVPLLRGDDTQWRGDALVECWSGARGPGVHAAVRGDRWKYVEYYEDDDMTEIRQREADGLPELELYDLANDPHELYNLVHLVVRSGMPFTSPEAGVEYRPEDLAPVLADRAAVLGELRSAGERE